MHKRFIIIHPSEICRKGIQSILRDGFDVDFILLENLKQLDDYSGLTDYILVFFIDNQWFKSFKNKYINDLKIKNKKVITFELHNSESENPQTINLLQSGNEIINQVKKTLNPEESKNSIKSELSDRELDVLQLVALGHANKEIAEKLFISIHTVITHRKHITEKLGIKSISGLTVYAILNKLIDTDNIDPSTLI